MFSLSASALQFIPKQANYSAPSGRELEAVQTRTNPSTRVQGADPNPTELNTVLEQRTRSLLTLYKADAWEYALRKAGLFLCFIQVPSGMCNGFLVDFPALSNIQSPPNKDSSLKYSNKFRKMIDHECAKGRYIGPFLQTQLLALVGPFQSSPISIIPKPGRPGKFRIVQNFSFPMSPSARYLNPSINSFINATNFPTSWGTFSIIYLLISRLPPGSEAATHDVAEAYRTIPLHPSQWPAAVVRATHNELYIDTCTAFSAAPSAGIYGLTANAGVEIFRSRGIGPLDKWVDDHIFLCIRSTYLDEYNTKWEHWSRHISTAGGMKQSGSRSWFAGLSSSDGSIEEFNENCSFPIKDLSRQSVCSEHNAVFMYTLDDIDRVSDELGIPWEKSKDQPFAPSTTYIGFVWDLRASTVSLAPSKIEKYLAAIDEWTRCPMHILNEVQSLYSKLLHACAVLPQGRTYLTALERMMRVCHNKPFMLHHPVKGTDMELAWWTAHLQQGNVARPIKPPTPFTDASAFSDASSGMGIAIVIGERWHAWTLHPDWKSMHGSQHDIGWAEAIGFKLLIRTLNLLPQTHSHVIVYGNNTGVVEGWWNGRHRNIETNHIFRQIHNFLLEARRLRDIRTSYIPSAANPADDPSHGIYDSCMLLLPRVPVPPQLLPFITDVEDTPPSQSNPPRVVRTPPIPAEHHHNNAAGRTTNSITHIIQSRQEEHDLVCEALHL